MCETLQPAATATADRAEIAEYLLEESDRMAGCRGLACDDIDFAGIVFIVFLDHLNAAGVVEIDGDYLLSRHFRLEKGYALGPAADVVPDLRIKCPLRRRRAELSDHVLTAGLPNGNLSYLGFGQKIAADFLVAAACRQHGHQCEDQRETTHQSNHCKSAVFRSAR